MLIRNMLIKYYSAAGSEGGEGGGSGGGAPEITPEIQKLIDEQVSAQVSGLKNKNSELLGKLKESTESLKRFEGIDPDAMKTILQRFSDDEEAPPGKLTRYWINALSGYVLMLISKSKPLMNALKRRKRSPANSVIVSWVMLSAAQRLRLARCQKHPTI